MVGERLRELETRFAQDPNDLTNEIALLGERERNGVLRLGYSFVPEQVYAKTYGIGLRLLRESVRLAHLTVGIHPSMNVGARFVARPLTFKETVRARIAQFVQNGNKYIEDDLFSRSSETCTAIVHKKHGTKFKIIPLCDALVQLPENFNQEFISGINYDSIRAIELDSAQGIYDWNLTRAEVSTHPAWLAAVEGDRALLDTYSDIVFAGKRRAMRFWVFGNRERNELRALSIGGSGSDFLTCGANLNNSARFVRIRPL